MEKVGIFLIFEHRIVVRNAIECVLDLFFNAREERLLLKFILDDRRLFSLRLIENAERIWYVAFLSLLQIL